MEVRGRRVTQMMVHRLDALVAKSKLGQGREEFFSFANFWQQPSAGVGRPFGSRQPG